MDENKITSLLLQLADLDITGINVYYEGVSINLKNYE